METDNLRGQLFMKLGECSGSSIDFIVKPNPDYPITEHQFEVLKDELAEAFTSVLNKHFASDKIQK